ncbi:endonuclease/exonuclease/phosphatase family protein [Streptomyces sp. NPDC006670]|uniref:endonuclease/exonuclease/phosphatase family protein n=1 Tax=Streptomyces sp. NPDC006670 TaxID=3154476 RepID=UPI00340B85FE
MPLIVAGDFNSIERDQPAPAQGVFGRWERLPGLLPGRRPHRRLPASSPTPGSGSTPHDYRVDHLFVSTPHAVRVLACGYHQEAREAGLTDQRPNVGVSANRRRAACPCAARVGAPRTFGKPRNHRVRKPSERNRCSKSCGVVEHGNDATTCTRGGTH